MEYDPFISSTDLAATSGLSIDPAALITKISLDAACQRVRTYLGQTINFVANDVEVHSGSGRRKLRLRERPVRAVDLVVVDDEVVLATEYTVRNAVITMKDSGIWSYGNDNIAVTYDHGYDIAENSDWNVPADIRLVTLTLAERIYSTMGSSASGALISETIGDYSYTLSDAEQTVVSTASELLEAERYALDRYRIDLVGDTPTY